MACGTSSAPSEQHLSTMSGTTDYAWFTSWRPATGLDFVSAVMRIKNLTGNFQGRLAIQTADTRTDNPNAPTLLEAGYTNTQDHSTGVLNVASHTAVPMFARFGVAYNLSGGGSLGAADVSLELSWVACGQMAGGGTYVIQSPNTTSHYVAVTPWIPCLHAELVKAALIVTATLGNFRCQLAYRTAATRKEFPSAWSSNWENNAWHGGNGEYTTGELPPTLGTNMWVQIGIEHQLSSGSDGEAIVSVAVGVRRL